MHLQEKRPRINTRLIIFIGLKTPYNAPANVGLVRVLWLRFFYFHNYAISLQNKYRWRAALSLQSKSPQSRAITRFPGLIFAKRANLKRGHFKALFF